MVACGLSQFSGIPLWHRPSMLCICSAELYYKSTVFCVACVHIVQVESLNGDWTIFDESCIFLTCIIASSVMSLLSIWSDGPALSVQRCVRINWIFLDDCKVTKWFLMQCKWFVYVLFMPSVLWHCWLGSSKAIRCGYLFGARCRLAYRPADATATHCLLLQ